MHAYELSCDSACTAWQGIQHRQQQKAVLPWPVAGGEWWSAVALMLGFCVFALAVRRSLLAEGVVQHILTAQPWHAWAVGCAVLTALYAQSFGG